MAETVVETVSLRRIFSTLVAVDNLDLKVERQQFYGFLGPNGAGKSTTIKMLTGLLRPTNGQIRIFRQGRMVAAGSLEELRAGVRVAGHEGSPLTLEEIFLQVVGGSKQDAEVLSWL